MKQEVCTEKECRKCHIVLPIENFRVRTSGFILNQCRGCESELGKARRVSKTEVSPIISITTKSGLIIEACLKPIIGGRMTTSPLSDKVLYFNPDTNRDKARLAYSTYAGVVRTGISYQPFQL